MLQLGCLLRTDLLLDVSGKVKALSIRLSGYTAEDVACSDAFWCTVRLTGHFSAVCNVIQVLSLAFLGGLSCLTNHRKGNHGSILPVP